MDDSHHSMYVVPSMPWTATIHHPARLPSARVMDMIPDRSWFRRLKRRRLARIGAWLCFFMKWIDIYIYIYWRVCKDFYRFHPQQVLTLLYSVYGTKEVSHMCERPWWDMGDSTWENTLMTFKVCFLQCNVSPWRQQSHNFVLLVIAWERNRMRRRGLSVLQ